MRRADDAGAAKLGGHRGSGAPLGCRAGPTIGARAAAQPRCSPSSSSGLVVLFIGENPLEAVAAPDLRRARLRRGHRLHALLRHQLHLHRPLPSPSPSMPACSTSAARARPMSAASASRWSASRSTRGCPGGWSLPARDRSAAGAVRRRLGVHPGLAAGQARQPHRHHHDHVQLHRRGADGLSAGQRADASRVDGAGDARLRARRLRCPACTRSCWRCSASTSASAPLNLACSCALVAAFLVWVLIWRTRLGYEMRTVGHNPSRGRLCRHLRRRASSSSPC